MSKMMEETERVIEEEEEEEEKEGLVKQEIWSWGAGTEGQLGTGKLQDEYQPQLIHSLSSLGSISYLSCGGAHVIALTPGGRVVTWGRGTSGQLGHGEMVNCLRPKYVESLEGFFITQASAGWNHSGFVSDTGHVFTCGDGSFGQLGHGDYVSRCSPVQVLYFKTKHVEQITCGMRHSLVLLKGDTEDLIYGFGSGKRGQLGISDDKQKSVSTPQVTLGFENVKIRIIAANGDHSAAISVNGHLYVWGRAFCGASDVYRPRHVTADLSFIQVALGWNHALVLTDLRHTTLIGDGEVYMLGRYNYNVPAGTQKANSMKHISDEVVMQRILDFNSRKVVQIGAGAEHSALVTDDGSVMTWGWGEHGQLGLGDTDDQTDPQIVERLFPVDPRLQASLQITTVIVHQVAYPKTCLLFYGHLDKIEFIEFIPTSLELKRFYSSLWQGQKFSSFSIVKNIKGSWNISALHLWHDFEKF
ncbi:ultraviolet-B receptor UVR8 isoform X1 [Nicotiana tomentosiformis]|uniref:ultraviolet-B receptor UVR8 isoform X1 n=1 Tax=Nicotiana tomentosiformis TaxID=4098 RepID=UPI00388C5D40